MPLRRGPIAQVPLACCKQSVYCLCENARLVLCDLLTLNGVFVASFELGDTGGWDAIAHALRFFFSSIAEPLAPYLLRDGAAH
jgi:hypothetical protein